MIDNVSLPSKLNAKGKVKIELFDNLTEEKVEEVKTENFIAKGIEYYYKILMMNQFTQNKGTGSIDHEVDNMFARMVLTDADHKEQPEKEWYMKGKEIGYALTTDTYSGNDELRGGYNIAESFTTQEQVHIVVDFPTHSGNGTFQSIYFTPENTPRNYGFFRPFMLDGFPGVIKVQKYNNEIWVLHSTGTGTSASTSSSISKFDENYNHIETYQLPHSKSDFYIHNNNIYFVNIGTDRNLERASILNPTNLTTIINQRINGDERLAGIVFDNKNNQFVISSSDTNITSGSSSSSISRFDTNFNMLSNTQYVMPNGGYYYQKLVINDDGEIFLCGYNRSYRIENNIAQIDAKIGLVTGIIDDYKVMRNGEVMPQTGISSRALLPSAVTKNSQQTMKITYDFMLPSLFD